MYSLSLVVSTCQSTTDDDHVVWWTVLNEREVNGRLNGSQSTNDQCTELLGSKDMA